MIVRVNIIYLVELFYEKNSLFLRFIWFFCIFLFSQVRADIPTDCNSPSDMPSETFICTFPQIKKLNLQLKKLLGDIRAKASDIEQKAIEDYLYKANSKSDECKDSKCIVELIQQIFNGLKSKEYLLSCSKPKLSPECEIYAINTDDRNNLNKELFLTEKEFTTMRKLRINRPGKCIYLVIESLYPAVWDIYVTPQTDIREIFAAGDYPQMIRGFNEKTKINNHNAQEQNVDPKQCLSKYVNFEQFASQLSDLGFESSKINFFSDEIIGEIAPQDQYLFNGKNINGKFVTPEIMPADKGMQLLEQTGKLRRATKTDLEAIDEAGFYTLGGREFIWGKDKYRQTHYPSDNNYLILADIDILPDLRNIHPSPKLYFPRGVALPKALDLRLNGFFASSFRINAEVEKFSAITKQSTTLETQRYLVDCNKNLNVLESYICGDTDLRKNNLELNQLLANQPEESKAVIDAFVDFWRLRLLECSSRNCLMSMYQERKKWLKDDEASKLLPQNIPSRCQLGELPASCEFYAYSVGEDSSYSPMPDVYLNDKHETYNQKFYINNPEKCVVLFLSGHDPVVWDIYTTQNTNLKAVVVGGYYEQMLRGMDGKVITKNRNGNFNQSGNDVCLPIDYDANEIVNAVKDLYLGDFEIKLLKDNYIGDKLPDDAYTYNPEIINGNFITPELFPGEKGLKQLFEQSKIRQGNVADIEKIKSIGFEFLSGSHPVKYAKKSAFSFGARNMYIMLSNFEKLPKDLGGSNSINLFIPKDLTPPDTNGGHNNFYRINASLAEFEPNFANYQPNDNNFIGKDDHRSISGLIQQLKK